jgi:hypothetical protein
MATDWKTKLVVTYTDATGKEDEISPIQSFTPTFSTNAEPIHSIERTHVGVVYSPQSLTFQMTVSAVGDAAAKLTALALTGKRFKVVLKEKEGNDWAFNTIVMDECIITSAGPSNASISGTPQASFSGFSMHVEATDAANTTTKAPPQTGG